MLNRNEINQLCDAGKLIYCVDMDGTLYDLFTGEPNNKLIDIINKRYEAGHHIYIYTASDRPTFIAAKLKECGVKYHEIIFGKPKAHIYIDDSTVDVKDYVRQPHKFDKLYQEYGNKINEMIRCGKTTL